MKILITGAGGFVGRNLVATLENIRSGKAAHALGAEELTLFPYDLDTPPEALRTFCEEADFVVHLAGVNRPEKEEDFMRGNFGFSKTLLDTLSAAGNRCPVLLSSSIQASLDNPYGRSKKAGEALFFAYGRETGAKVLVYRFPNVFGKWCRPGYNSVVATFCHQIARDNPIEVRDAAHKLNLVYIDDVVSAILDALCGKEKKEGDFCVVEPIYPVTLGEIADLLKGFRESRETKEIPDMTGFSGKLYSTYLSYLPADAFSYPAEMHADARGSFTELFRTAERGQVSVNITKPGITKGNHWHHTKNEKFAVVSGRGVIRFRRPDDAEIIEYFVSGDKIEIVDIPTGYTHNIENLGDEDLVTIMWANERFCPEKPDTYFLEV